MFRNSLYRPCPPDAPYGNVPSTNINFIEIMPNKSLRISKSIPFPEEVISKTYIIEKLSHIEIALKVLNAEISAKDGLENLCQEEGLPNIFCVEHLPLGSLLASLYIACMPENKKIQYIDSNIREDITKQIDPCKSNQIRPS